jgi:hypothetical protein
MIEVIVCNRKANWYLFPPYAAQLYWGFPSSIEKSCRVEIVTIVNSNASEPIAAQPNFVVCLCRHIPLSFLPRFPV